MLFTILSFLLLISYSGIILYYLHGWIVTKTFKDKNVSIPDEVLISVIIVARNESTNIRACLSSVANQTLEKGQYEIILVDDHSTDDTVSIAEQLNIPNLTILPLKTGQGSQINSYKKLGIARAIKKSAGKIIVTTDADCVVKQNWLKRILHFYAEYHPVFIAAPVTFSNGNATSLGKKLLVIFQQLDFMVLQGITGASVSTQFHNMCNGANLAYTKTAFSVARGFDGIDDIASGDDMLLMRKIEKAFPGRIKYLKSKDAIVTTEPVTTIKDFFNQRIRWASKAGRYSDFRITSVLLLVYIFNCWLLMTLVLGFFSTVSFEVFVIMIITKTLVELLFLAPLASFFKKMHLLWWFIPAQPFHILYTIIAGGLGKYGTYQWKGRKVK